MTCSHGGNIEGSFILDFLDGGEKILQSNKVGNQGQGELSPPVHGTCKEGHGSDFF